MSLIGGFAGETVPCETVRVTPQPVGRVAAVETLIFALPVAASG
jgi:hypothetical protein